jgi:hypothetical protein
MQYDIMENLRAQLAEVTRERDALKLDLQDAEGRYEMENTMRKEAEATRIMCACGKDTASIKWAQCYNCRQKGTDALEELEKLRDQLFRAEKSVDDWRTIDRPAHEKVIAELKDEAMLSRLRGIADAEVAHSTEAFRLLDEENAELKSQLAIMDQMASDKNELVKQVERLRAALCKVEWGQYWGPRIDRVAHYSCSLCDGTQPYHDKDCEVAAALAPKEEK